MGRVRSSSLEGARARLLREVRARNGTVLRAGEEVTVGGATRARRRGCPQRLDLWHEDGRMVLKVERDAVLILEVPPAPAPQEPDELEGVRRGLFPPPSRGT